jgi:hypothetical protein
MEQCCGTEMFIPDLDFYQPRIPDSTTASKEEETFFYPTIFCSHKYQKIVNDFIFEYGFGIQG